jgi:hypothetical protein
MISLQKSSKWYNQPIRKKICVFLYTSRTFYEETATMPVYLVTLVFGFVFVWLLRHAAEETVVVMTASIAAILLICGIILAPWPIQLAGFVILLVDRLNQGCEEIL